MVLMDATEYAPSDWPLIREQAVMIGQLSQSISVEQLEAAIAHGDRALSLGPILDPTLAREASGQLQIQLGYLRALLKFRRAVAELVEAPEVSDRAC